MPVNYEGMALADGVVETLVAMALKDVDGVACVGSSQTPAGILAALTSKAQAQAVEVTSNEEGGIDIGVHVEVYAGNVLPDVAATIRQAVVDAVLTQVGIPVSTVDVYIDGIQFS